MRLSSIFIAVGLTLVCTTSVHAEDNSQLCDEFSAQADELSDLSRDLNIELRTAKTGFIRYLEIRKIDNSFFIKSSSNLNGYARTRASQRTQLWRIYREVDAMLMVDDSLVDNAWFEKYDQLVADFKAIQSAELLAANNLEAEKALLTATIASFSSNPLNSKFKVYMGKFSAYEKSLLELAMPDGSANYCCGW